MPQFSFEDSLRTELHPSAVDFPETSFFRPREASPNGPSPALPTPTEVRGYTGNEHYDTVALLDLGLFVKWGREHLAFPNNEVPVPELVAWRSENDINYIYMTLVPGATLESCWSTLTTSERETIANQLGGISRSLRSVRQRPEIEYIGALDHGPFQASYFCGQTVGPFIDTKAFNDAVQFWSLSWLPMEKRFPDPVRHLLPDDAAICFSHGDLHLDNMMVAGEPGSRQISGAIDWGEAGWYPIYWEYVSMLRFVFDHEWSTQGWLDRVMDRWPDEDEAILTYWSWHGPA